MLKGKISSDITNDLILDPAPEGEDQSPAPFVNPPAVNNDFAADDSLTPQNYLPPPPPHGDETKAEQYVQRLIHLINAGKVTVTRTDLQKFEISGLQDHYFINLGGYEIEVSHSKHLETGRDFFVMLFNNIKQVEAKCATRVILAYSHLNAVQFSNFKAAAGHYLGKQKREEENKRFQEAMAPIDQVLGSISLRNNDKT